MLEWLLQLDGQILLWIQEYLRFDFLTPVFIVITKLGDAGAVWIVLTVILMINRKTRKAGCMSALALLFALLADNMILKNLVARIRPYEVVDGLQLLIEKQVDFSFPSGHTGSSFASAVVCFTQLPKKYGVPLLVLAVLIGCSRLYVGVHYPSDVLAGALIGTALALLAIRIVDKVTAEKNTETAE